MGKRCAGCGEFKPESSYSVNNAKADRLSTRCKACMKLVQDAWYQKNKAVHKKNVRQRGKQQAAAMNKYVNEYLFVHSCVDCGESDWVVLEFDHVKGIKVANVQRMCDEGLSLKTIQKEIEKCEVRCVNCHRRRHCKSRFCHLPVPLMDGSIPVNAGV